MLRKRVIKHGVYYEDPNATQVCGSQNIEPCQGDYNYSCSCDCEQHKNQCPSYIITCRPFWGESCTCEQCVNVCTCDCNNVYCSSQFTCTKYYCTGITDTYSGVCSGYCNDCTFCQPEWAP